MLLQHVNLPELDGACARFNRQCRRTELQKADDLPIFLGDPEAIARIGEFFGT
jgi:hypothetical protein